MTAARLGVVCAALLAGACTSGAELLAELGVGGDGVSDASRREGGAGDGPGGRDAAVESALGPLCGDTTRCAVDEVCATGSWFPGGQCARPCTGAGDCAATDRCVDLARERRQSDARIRDGEPGGAGGGDDAAPGVPAAAALCLQGCTRADDCRARYFCEEVALLPSGEARVCIRN